MWGMHGGNMVVISFSVDAMELGEFRRTLSSSSVWLVCQTSRGIMGEPINFSCFMTWRLIRKAIGLPDIL